MKRTLAPTLVAAGLLAAACTGSDGSVGDEPADEPGEQTDDGEDVVDDPGDDPDDEPDEPDDDQDGDQDGDPDDPGDGGDDPDDGTGPVGFAAASLRQFDECDDFLDYVHTEGAERVGAYGFDDDGWFPTPFLEDVAAVEPEIAMEEPAEGAADEASGSAPAGDGPAAGDGTFSTTNVQVEGVDEPDIVKTDGARILAVAGEQLHLASVSPDGADGTLRSSVALSGADSGTWIWGAELLFDGDRAFVIGQSDVWSGVPEPFPAESTVDAVADDEESGDAVSAPESAPIPPAGGYLGPTTVVHEVDLSDPDSITIVNTLEVRGRYVSARQIGSTARVVVTSRPADLGFVFPSDGSDRSIEAATETNQRLVAESDLEHWLPTYTLRTQQGVSEGELVECANIHAPSEFAGFDMLSVVTFGTDEALGAPDATTSVMATGDTVYASQDRMYVTTNVWLPPTIEDEQRGAWEEQYETQIHRFTIAGDGPAQYEASGTVEGHLLNQFSMNDRAGTLFVATTEGTPWGMEDTDNQIIAMEADGDRLVEVGRVEGLGLEGERIFSVRYVDDVAYLVTFRQTDPFYVVDLSDPTNMTVVGELKIPGFSSYLHPIGDTLVLGVGQDATDDGRTTGTKVSLFDVSDPANPVELDVWTLPGGGSDAEWDHRAFLYWPATETAFLPVNVWSENFSGAVALRVNENGIEELGRITQVEPDEAAPGQTDCRVVTAEEFGDDPGDLAWIADEGLVLACDEQDRGGATGYFCDPIPTDDLRFWTVDGEVPDALAGTDRIEICWPEGIDWQRQIRRTLVIGDSLWSLSETRLQSNDLASLAVSDVVDLPVG